MANNNEIKINVSDTDLIVLNYASDPEQWLNNVVSGVVHKYKQEIISNLITHCNENSIALAVGEEAQIIQAQSLGLKQEVYQIL
jgi:hypothetical protein